MEAERRKSPRIEVEWPITLSNRLSRIEGATLNISADGVSFCSEAPVRLEEDYHIVIHPPGHRDVEVSGNVTWSDLYGMDEEKKTFCMGVCFLEIPDEDRMFIEDMITGHLK
jgi:hypothetical protein